MDYLLIYAWTRLDTLASCISGLLIASAVIIAVYFIYCCVYNADASIEREIFNGKRYMKICKKSCIAWLILLLFLILVPSKKDAAIIFFTPKIVNSEAMEDTMAIINRLPKAMREEIEEWLDSRHEALKERTKDKEKSKGAI